MISAPRATALRPRITAGVPLSALASLLAEPAPGPGQDGVLVTGVTLDSRLVAPGDLYVALPGRAHHGARFAAEAVQSGAVAVLTDAVGQSLTAGLGRPLLVADDPRRAMAPMAARIYGEPARAMNLLAVTGTNGKTTTSFLLDAALRAAGRHTGVIGTIGFLLDGTPLNATRTTVTTPEAPELQALLAFLVEGGVQDCVMEVSSHALALGRADAITFDVAAFTNFGRDHLDFHGDEESYFEAKALLFTPGHTRSAVVNVDDVRGRLLVDRLTAAELPFVTVSLADSTADFWVSELELGADGLTSVRLRTPDQVVEFKLGLPGAHNVANAVTALAMIEMSRAGRTGQRLFGVSGVTVDLARAAGGLEAARVPGRMERVPLGPAALDAAAPAVFVDFAHTPQAVTAALTAVAGRRRIAVLGCGGDRDPDKRGPIGAAAARHAEVVVVTDDNPRSEDPAAIRRQVLAGAAAAVAADGLATMVVDGGDRRSAICRGLGLAGAADVVLILGKGHEPGQETADGVTPFNDVDVVRDEWAALATSSTR